MTELLPILEELRDATGWRAQAEWLSSVPLGVVQRDHLRIRELLKRDGFEAGDAYLTALVATINARRLADGRYPQTVVLALEIARISMWDAVRGKGE